MEAKELVGKFIDLGWWGVVAAVFLILVAAAGSLIIVRYSRSSNDTGISLQRIGISFLSICLFLVSGTWSGWAKYTTYIESNEILAWVIAIGFVLCGGVTAVVLQLFASMAIDESKYSRKSLVAFMIVASGIWLGISPFFNARLLCENETIKREIEERFTELDQISQPVLAEYDLFRTKLVPQLADIHRYLETMVAEQSTEELGGCGKICRRFEKSADMLWPSVNRLYRIYDPDDQERDLSAKIVVLRNSIVNLLAGNIWSAEEMRTQFYQAASTWAVLIASAEAADPPAFVLERAMADLNTLLLFLKDYQVANRGNQIESLAVTTALSTLEPLVNDLQMAFLEDKGKGDLRPVNFIDHETGQTTSINLAAIASIRMGTKLMRKHIGAIWPDALMAFYIDLIAMFFIYGPMVACFLRGREVQQAIDQVRKKELRVQKEKTRLKKLSPFLTAHEREKNTLLDSHEGQQKELNEQRAKAIVSLENKLAHLLEEITSKRDKLVSQMNSQLQEVTKDLTKAIQKATSSAEENLLKGKHQVYQENIREKFAGQLRQLDGQEVVLKQEYAKKNAKLTNEYGRRAQQAKDSFQAELTIVDSKYERLEKLKNKHTGGLAKAETELEAALKGLKLAQEG